MLENVRIDAASRWPTIDVFSLTVLTLKGAYNSFYAVIAASVVSGIALVIW
jgi:hypothetical protein